MATHTCQQLRMANDIIWWLIVVNWLIVVFLTNQFLLLKMDGGARMNFMSCSKISPCHLSRQLLSKQPYQSRLGHQDIWRSCLAVFEARMCSPALCSTIVGHSAVQQRPAPPHLPLRIVHEGRNVQKRWAWRFAQRCWNNNCTVFWPWATLCLMNLINYKHHNKYFVWWNHTVYRFDMSNDKEQRQWTTTATITTTYSIDNNQPPTTNNPKVKPNQGIGTTVCNRSSDIGCGYPGTLAVHMPWPKLSFRALQITNPHTSWKLKCQQVAVRKDVHITSLLLCTQGRLAIRRTCRGSTLARP